MASEVAPCMPLQLFRRSMSGGRRPRLPEVAKRIAEDLDTLEASASSSARAADDDGPAVPADGSVQTSAELLRPVSSDKKKTLSEDIAKQLQTALQAFTDIGELAEKGDSRHGQTGSGERCTLDEGNELLSQLLALDLPARLVANLGDLEFEVRKDVSSLFSTIVRLGSLLNADKQVQEYAFSHPRFFKLLVEGYDRHEVATHCGMMLRTCARHQRLVEAFFQEPEVALRLLSFTRNESFDISSDAFSSLHDFLLTHKALSAVYIEANFKDFFAQYNKLLQQSHSDYVTQRQALKLLSEMLLNRTFMRVMLAYVGDDVFLQIHMNLLREDSKAIQFEAFHVFKIFVANPQKPPRVQQILFKNKEKLIKLLETLRPSRQDDRQFAEDRSTVIEKLQVLDLPPKAAVSADKSLSAAAGYVAAALPAAACSPAPEETGGGAAAATS